MCVSAPAPRIPPPPPPPHVPPPPTKVAQKVENRTLKKRATQSRRRGVSSLTIRRPSVSVNSMGTGANVSY